MIVMSTPSMTKTKKIGQYIQRNLLGGFSSGRRVLNWFVYIPLAGMMLITFIDVMGRYFFNKPLPGSYELTEMIMAILGGFTMFYAATTRGHINVDLFLLRFSERTQVILSVIGSLLGSGIWALVAYQIYLSGGRLIKSGQYSQTIHIPEAPFLFILALGLLLYCLTELLYAFRLLISKKQKDVHTYEP